MTNNKELLQHHDLIAGIVTAMEERDNYTSMHSMRVAAMTESLCRYLNLSNDEITAFHIAAHLHDIGKIGIPDSVLGKSGALSNSEWELMKMHPVIGYRILCKINSFSEISKIVRSHHEREDGKGYPDGLSGMQIPLGARIIAVADSIDAMLSDRPYRKGLTTDHCYREIEKNSGIMYEKEIASITLFHWEQLIESRKAYPLPY